MARSYSRLLVELDADLKDRLTEQAIRERRSMRDIVVTLITQYLAQQEPKP